MLMHLIRAQQDGTAISYQNLHIVLQGRGFLTGAIKQFEDVPEQQRQFNPRMSEEENFNKVLLGPDLVPYISYVLLTSLCAFFRDHLTLCLAALLRSLV